MGWKNAGRNFGANRVEFRESERAREREGAPWVPLGPDGGLAESHLPYFAKICMTGWAVIVVAILLTYLRDFLRAMGVDDDDDG